MDKIQAIKDAALSLLDGKVGDAKLVINENYPFNRLASTERKYTDKQKMEQFVRDGFIDRYSGQKLMNPGILKVLSYYMPEDFPYHAHWKMEECHNAYWEFVPTVDHIYPVALGGADAAENWASTSMLHNSIKNNWTLEQLQWKLYDAGDFQDWDGLTDLFIQLVEANDSMLVDPYIKKWYKLSKNAVEAELQRAYSFSSNHRIELEKDENSMDNRIDLICQHTMEGKIIPMRMRLRDEDGELQEYTIKGYRDTSEFGLTSFECKIVVHDTMRLINIFSSDCKVWRRK